jgi:cold shock CspA family protein
MQYTGTVRLFDQRGFGFIISDDPNAIGYEDVYFHASELPGKRGTRSIEDGTRVTFELGTYKTPTNVVAKKVRPIVASENGGGNEPK